MSQNTDQLIEKLRIQLKPVKVVKFSNWDILQTILWSLTSLVIVIFALGLRADFLSRFYSWQFSIENILLLTAGIVSVFAAFHFCIPSNESPKLYKSPFFILPLLSTFTLYSFVKNPSPFLYLGHGFACVLEVVAIGLVPTLVIIQKVRSAAILNREYTGALVFTCGLSFGLLGVQFTCSDSTPLHTGLWHILPGALIVFAGMKLAKKMWKKI